MEGVWTDVAGSGRGLNPLRSSIKSTTALRKKMGDRPGKSHDELIQSFNKYGALKNECTEVEALRNHSSS